MVFNFFGVEVERKSCLVSEVTLLTMTARSTKKAEVEGGTSTVTGQILLLSQLLMDFAKKYIITLGLLLNALSKGRSSRCRLGPCWNRWQRIFLRGW